MSIKLEDVAALANVSPSRASELNRDQRALAKSAKDYTDEQIAAIPPAAGGGLTRIYSATIPPNPVTGNHYLGGDGSGGASIQLPANAASSNGDEIVIQSIASSGVNVSCVDSFTRTSEVGMGNVGITTGSGDMGITGPREIHAHFTGGQWVVYCHLITF